MQPTACADATWALASPRGMWGMWAPVQYKDLAAAFAINNADLFSNPDVLILLSASLQCHQAVLLLYSRKISQTLPSA